MTPATYIAVMDFAPLLSGLGDVISAVPRSGLLLATIVAMVVGWIGSAMISRKVAGGKLIRGLGSLALGAILVTLVLQLSRFDPRLEVAVPQLGLPEQRVEGGETVVPLAADGHYWLEADVNGVPVRFLVDTGATLTAVSAETAQRAGLTARTGGVPIMISTANGTVHADLTTLDQLSFGNITAEGLDAVIAPNLGRTNVIGMNFLSRLEGWRVERGDLILSPAVSDQRE
ncbi:TIGR02281 family clan AA aspartic protease [Qipengyuania sp.]|uniref:retropepsin-like aspartic protease family protein n=1 Tax=Qipengyuania sp. TaxID=2004515 RepID=UPI003735C0C7